MKNPSRNLGFPKPFALNLLCGYIASYHESMCILHQTIETVNSIASAYRRILCVQILANMVNLKRLRGLLVAPYVQRKMALRLKGDSFEFDGFPQSVVTRSDAANVKAKLLTTANDSPLEMCRRQQILLIRMGRVLFSPNQIKPLGYRG